jgi:hypothetical protein
VLASGAGAFMAMIDAMSQLTGHGLDPPQSGLTRGSGRPGAKSPTVFRWRGAVRKVGGVAGNSTLAGFRGKVGPSHKLAHTLFLPDLTAGGKNLHVSGLIYTPQHYRSNRITS